MTRLTIFAEIRKKPIHLVGIVILFLNSFYVDAQNPTIDSLLRKISSCQRTYSDSLYQTGMIPSQRIHMRKKKYCREDENIFFTGLVVWTLRTHRVKLTEQNQLLADSICRAAIKNYPRFKNKRGECSYNFWPTNPSNHFPNDSYFSTRPKFAIPDDLDDTAILYLSDDYSDSLKKKFKEKISYHSNNKNGKIIKSTFKRYKHRKAYNVWFGKKMPLEFDISVQCNGLRWVLDNKMELDESDRETIRLIQDMVLADDHLRHAAYISPYYPNSVIILFHLARLVAAHPEAFPLIREKLIKDLEIAFNKTKVPMEKLILNTSLARFGLPQKKMADIQRKDFDGFYFFAANLTCTMPNPIKRWMAASRRVTFYYESEGYYWTLLFENECLK